ncbi:MAG: Rieske 2Fe-2S domain-containing protein [Rhodocyclaceae bacterium]
MVASERLICRSADLVDGGPGQRFEIEWEGAKASAFAIRDDGRVFAYLNRCAHIPVELDWMPGQFFDAEGLYLVCATHGAAYEPRSGHCVGGPCRGASLIKIEIREYGGAVYY